MVHFPVVTERPAAQPTCPAPAEGFEALMNALARTKSPGPADVCPAFQPSRQTDDKDSVQQLVVEKDGRIKLLTYGDPFEAMGVPMDPVAVEHMLSLGQPSPRPSDNPETEISHIATETEINHVEKDIFAKVNHILARAKVSNPKAVRIWYDPMPESAGFTFHLGPIVIASDPALEPPQQASYIQARMDDLTKLADTDAGSLALRLVLQQPLHGRSDLDLAYWVANGVLSRWTQHPLAYVGLNFVYNQVHEAVKYYSDEMLIAPVNLYYPDHPELTGSSRHGFKPLKGHESARVLFNFDGVDQPIYFDRNGEVPSWARNTPTPILLFRSILLYLKYTQGTRQELSTVVYVHPESGEPISLVLAYLRMAGLGQFDKDVMTERQLRAEMGEDERTFVLSGWELNPDNTYPLIKDVDGNVIDIKPNYF